MKALASALLFLFPVAAFAGYRLQQPPGDGYAADPAAPEIPPADTLAAPSFLESIGILDMSQTRGERNNNPGNLRPGSPWQGLNANQTDPGYLQFSSAAAGVRAMAKLLQNYQTVYNLRSVRQIIARWAPASENNTAAYVRAVAAALGVGADDSIDLTDKVLLRALVVAIINHENGRNIYSAADIDQGVNAA